MTIKEVVINRETISLEKLVHSNNSKKMEIFEGRYLDLPVAVKRYRINEEEPHTYFAAKTEIRNMLQKPHPNFNSLMQSFQDDEYIYLILERCEMKFTEIPPMTNENDLKSFVKNILQMLKFMYDNNIVHSNISINKIMFNRGINGELIPKLIDFSQAQIFDHRNNMESTITHAVDVYSASEVLYYAATQNPFQYERSKNLSKKIMMYSNISDHSKFLLASLIDPMLTAEPGQRPPATALLSHIYLQAAEDVLHFINGCKSKLMGGCGSKYKLEIRCDQVTRNEWKDFPYMRELMDGRHYNSTITDLLRLIRNKTEHPSYSIAHPMRDPEGFLQFFTNYFPTLIAWTWHVMYAESSGGELQRFYPSDHTYVSQVPIEEILFN